MRRVSLCFMLLCLFSLKAFGGHVVKFELSRPVSITGQDKKVDLGGYLARRFGDALHVKKGCATISLSSDWLFHPHSVTAQPANWTSSIGSVLQICTRYPKTYVLVSAYTDCLFSEEQDLALSELQAWMIKQALVNNGLDAGKIKARGWGESKPVASNATREGRRQNRRITISFGPSCAGD